MTSAVHRSRCWPPQEKISSLLLSDETHDHRQSRLLLAITAAARCGGTWPVFWRQGRRAPPVLHWPCFGDSKFDNTVYRTNISVMYHFLNQLKFLPTSILLCTFIVLHPVLPHQVVIQPVVPSPLRPVPDNHHSNLQNPPTNPTIFAMSPQVALQLSSCSYIPVVSISSILNLLRFSHWMRYGLSICL